MPPQEFKSDDEGRWVYLKGGKIYHIDSEDHLLPLALHVITERQHERLRYLEQSFRRERV